MSSFGKKTKNPGYISGGHWVECERTGRAIRNWDAREEWTGIIVAKEEWEPRHPQDYIKAVEDDTSPKGLVSLESDTKYAGFSEAIAGVAICGLAVCGLVNTQDTDIPSSTYPVPTGQISQA